jgi:hypothetical protein
MLGLVILDMSSALDTAECDHSIKITFVSLCFDLQGDAALDWFHTYFSNRSRASHHDWLRFVSFPAAAYGRFTCMYTVYSVQDVNGPFLALNAEDISTFFS